MSDSTAIAITPAESKFLDLIKLVEGTQLDLTASDSGNWTGGSVGVGTLKGSKEGISAASYPTLDIANLTDETICFIYKTDYLDKVCFEQMPIAVGVIIADCAINQGVGAAKILLQQSVDVETDGYIGPQTLEAVNKYNSNPDPLVIEIAARRGLRYAQTNNLQTFGLGWFRRLQIVTAYAIKVSHGLT